MRATIVYYVAAILLAAAMVFAQFPPAPEKLVWEGMFAPPYIESPQIALAMDCVSPNKCYLAGGSNGAGFGVFTYDGKMNGQVIGPMQEPNMSMMVMDLAVGGAESDPKGAFCGITMFGKSKAFQYLANNGKEWLPSMIPLELIYVSEAITSNKDASLLVAVGEGPFSGGSNLMISTDYGVAFRSQKIDYKPDNCSAAGYIAIPSQNSWYMTFGNEPPQKNSNSGSGSKSGSSSSFGDEGDAFAPEAGIDAKYIKADEELIRRKANGQVLVIKNRKTGEIRTHYKPARQWYADQQENLRSQQGGDNSCKYYAGWILHSADQGKTWTPVYQNKNAQGSYIECFDADHCTAIFYNAGESYTVSTSNGKNGFKVTYTTPPASQTSAESVQAVAYASQQEVWVGGSMDSQQSGKGMFWSSTNGGDSFTPYPHTVPDVMAIMALDFEDGVGFALGMTMFKTSQIMRYKKQADYGTFTQKQCPIEGCTILCQELAFPQGMCLHASGGSAKAFCEADGLAQYMYETTSCVGSYKKYVQPVNKCLNGTNNYFENICPPTGRAAAGRKADSKRDKLMH